jgi:hypothetical protein
MRYMVGGAAKGVNVRSKPVQPREPHAAGRVGGSKPLEQLLRELVAEVGILRAQRSLELEIAVGKRIIEVLYNGKLVPWQRRGRSDARYRELSRHPDLPVTAAELYRVISSYVVSVRIPRISTSKRLTPSHVHAVLPLAPAEQERLLSDSEVQGWSVRRLQVAVDELHVPRVGPGRPRKAKVLRTLDLLARLGTDAFDDSDALLTVDSGQVEQMCTSVERFINELRHVRSILLRNAHGASASDLV